MERTPEQQLHQKETLEEEILSSLSNLNLLTHFSAEELDMSNEEIEREINSTVELIKRLQEQLENVNIGPHTDQP